MAIIAIVIILYNLYKSNNVTDCILYEFITECSLLVICAIHLPERKKAIRNGLNRSFHVGIFNFIPTVCVIHCYCNCMSYAD